MIAQFVGKYQQKTSFRFKSNHLYKQNTNKTGTEDQKKKVLENYEGFLEVATIYEYAGEVGDIKDPYGKSREEYECCFLQIKQLIDKIWKIKFA